MRLSSNWRSQHNLLRDRILSLRWEQVQKHRSASQLKLRPLATVVQRSHLLINSTNKKKTTISIWCNALNSYAHNQIGQLNGASLLFWVSVRPYLNRLKIVFQTILFRQSYSHRMQTQCALESSSFKRKMKRII